MTQARARAHGVVTPSASQLWLTATLRVLVRLVLGLVSTLPMIFNRRARDWHTDAQQEALPRETSEISQTGTTLSTVILGLVPRIPAASPRGTTTHSLCALNRDARHKAEHDAVGVVASRPLSPVIPAVARKREEREPRSHVHRLSSRKTRSAYPGPTNPRARFAKWIPARVPLGQDDNCASKTSLI